MFSLLKRILRNGSRTSSVTFLVHGFEIFIGSEIKCSHLREWRYYNTSLNFDLCVLDTELLMLSQKLKKSHVLFQVIHTCNYYYIVELYVIRNRNAATWTTLQFQLLLTILNHVFRILYTCLYIQALHTTDESIKWGFKLNKRKKKQFKFYFGLSTVHCFTVSFKKYYCQ